MKSYSLLIGFTAIALGICLVAYPSEAVHYLVLTIGGLFALTGVATLVLFLKNRTTATVLDKCVLLPVGVGSILLGAWMFKMPDFFTKSLMYVLGGLLILAGIVQFYKFATVRKVKDVNPIWYLFPLLVILAGATSILYPMQTASLPFTFLGISAIIYGIIDFIRFFKYRKPTPAKSHVQIEKTISTENASDEMPTIHLD